MATPHKSAKDSGHYPIVNQIDPAMVEFAIVREEEQAFHGWAMEPLEIPEAYNRRREAEWALADRIVVNSKWSAQALERQGVPPEKIVVIPLAYEASVQQPERTSQKHASGHPLKILFLGQVILRKGIQYLIQTAELLANEPVQFDIVGPLGINLKAIPSIPENLTFHGPVPRSEVNRFYRQADLFALPTLSDGFAITQLEAMAHGLPVLATRACGEVVTEGVDGWLLPTRDPKAWADKIREVLDRRESLGPMSVAALEKSKQFGLDRLAKNLLALEQELLTANS